MMNIITNENNLVIYAGEQVKLLSDRVEITPKKFDFRLNASNATFYDDVVLPNNFTGGCFTYTPATGFQITSYGVTALTSQRREDNPEKFLNDVDSDSYIESCSDEELRNVIKYLFKEISK